MDLLDAWGHPGTNRLPRQLTPNNLLLTTVKSPKSDRLTRIIHLCRTDKESPVVFLLLTGQSFILALHFSVQFHGPPNIMNHE